jgi:hypothetical protein
MALTLEPRNILEFFTFLSPIFISVFLLLQSSFNADLKGIVWMVGSFIAWVLGIGFKFFVDSRLRESAVNNTGTYNPTSNLQQSPGMGGAIRTGYCNVFDGPFEKDHRKTTSMPSLNAVFHAYTLLYFILGLSNSKVPDTGDYIFIIILLLNGITNLCFRNNLMCESKWDIFVGLILGAAVGTGWFYLINTTQPAWVYYGDSGKKEKCKLGKQKFRCSYD